MCDSPDCLFCATHAPRRDPFAGRLPLLDVPPEQDGPPSRVSERLSSFHAPEGRAVDFPSSGKLTDFINKYRLPPASDADASRPDHIHWAAGPQQAPRPWYLRAATRLFRMQPIHTVRDRVRVQWDRRSWYVGAFIGRDGGDVHMLCLTFVIDWSRKGWMRE